MEYGELIADAAKEIHSRATDAVETITGLEVVEINIKLLDVYLPGSDDERDDAADGDRSEKVS